MKAMAGWSVLGALTLGVAAMGCVSGTKAVGIAAFRSGCDAKKVKVVQQEGHNLVLDVCGTQEDWRFSALDGWQYIGPSSEQPDADKDGIADGLDACRGEPGVASDEPTRNGCPIADADKDGIADAQDACGNQAGVASADPKKHGCPSDRDGDGVIDAADACPEAPGVASADAKVNGCPPPPPPAVEPKAEEPKAEAAKSDAAKPAPAKGAPKKGPAKKPAKR